MDSEIRVLKFLVSDCRTKFSSRDIQEGTGLSINAVEGALYSLFQNGFIDRTLDGTITVHVSAVNELENRENSEDNSSLSKREKLTNIARNRITSIAAISQIPLSLYAVWELWNKMWT